MKKKFRITVAGETYEVEVEEITEGEGGVENSSTANSTKVKREDEALSNQKSERVDAPSDSGKSSTASPKKHAEKEEADAAGVERVEAPMAGKVLELEVSEGDEVNAGDLIMVLEAMKMENEIHSLRGGTVTSIVVSKEESVDAGDHIMTIER